MNGQNRERWLIERKKAESGETKRERESQIHRETKSGELNLERKQREIGESGEG